MQIQNNNSTNFQRIGLNTSQMNRSQKCLAENFYRAIEGSGKYKNIENDLIDIIIMPGKKDNNLIIKFIDKVSGKFIRNPENNVAAQHTYHGSGDIYKFSNKIIDNVLSFTSSNYGSAERQFRFPTAYGIKKKESTTLTVSGASCVILSNEASANESTVKGEDINHQYSKSFEMEQDLDEYFAS